MSEHANYQPHRNKQHNIKHKQNTLNKTQNHQQYNNIKNRFQWKQRLFN